MYRNGIVECPVVNHQDRLKEPVGYFENVIVEGFWFRCHYPALAYLREV